MTELAGELNPASVGVDNGFHDRQTQSRSLKTIVLINIGSTSKAMENSLLVCGDNAFSRIFHPEMQIPVLAGRADGYCIPFLSMTHRILHQIHHCLSKSLTV